MNSRANIACASGHHNRDPLVPSGPRYPGRLPARLWKLPVWLISVTAIGCAATLPQPVEVPLSRLMMAEPRPAVTITRVRVSFDRPLTANLVQELSPEYSLVSIRNVSEWAEVRRHLKLPAPRTPPNFQTGMVVGIMAWVGERADDAWPIRIDSVRTVSGVGWMKVSFLPGLYYPLRTAGYLELLYVDGLRGVSTIHINSRLFSIRPLISVN
jgi:hypothetical protein